MAVRTTGPAGMMLEVREGMARKGKALCRLGMMSEAAWLTNKALGAVSMASLYHCSPTLSGALLYTLLHAHFAVYHYTAPSHCPAPPPEVYSGIQLYNSYTAMQLYNALQYTTLYNPPPGAKDLPLVTPRGGIGLRSQWPLSLIVT